MYEINFGDRILKEQQPFSGALNLGDSANIVRGNIGPANVNKRSQQLLAVLSPRPLKTALGPVLIGYAIWLSCLPWLIVSSYLVRSIGDEQGE